MTKATNDRYPRGTQGNCRSGCPTKDHWTYSECARSVQLAIGEAHTLRQQAVDRELKAYRNARAEGIQPAGTQMHQVEYAKRASDASGVAFGV